MKRQSLKITFEHIQFGGVVKLQSIMLLRLQSLPMMIMTMN